MAVTFALPAAADSRGSSDQHLAWTVNSARETSHLPAEPLDTVTAYSTETASPNEFRYKAALEVWDRPRPSDTATWSFVRAATAAETQVHGTEDVRVAARIPSPSPVGAFTTCPPPPHQLQYEPCPL